MARNRGAGVPMTTGTGDIPCPSCATPLRVGEEFTVFWAAGDPAVVLTQHQKDDLPPCTMLLERIPETLLRACGFRALWT